MRFADQDVLKYMSRLVGRLHGVTNAINSIESMLYATTDNAPELARHLIELRNNLSRAIGVLDNLRK
jgi:hypothetical protein